jgi:DNA-directed RNA polymerase specialized sigma24 family protein
MTNERQEPFVNDSQVDTLIFLEERGALEECIAKLNDESQRFVRALLQSPPLSTEALAREFGCRETTIWVRKHRLTALLARCVEASM